MKNQKGITLVALVVTIIVLLILAGVTIMFVLQGDSIFGQANSAKKETHTANVRESVAVALAGVQTKYYVPETANTDFYEKDADGVVKAKADPARIATDLMKPELTKAGIDATNFELTSFAPNGTAGIATAEAGCTVKYNGVSYTVKINTKAASGELITVTPVE